MAAPRLKTNLAILVAGDALGKLINVVVFGRLGRILQPENYGHLEFALAAVFVGALIIEAGLGPWGARAVARGEEPAARILGRIIALRSLILALVILLLLGVAGWLGRTGRPWPSLLLLFGTLMLVPKAALCEWFFQGRNEMATVTATNLLEPAVALVGTLAFVNHPADLERVPFILAAAIASVAVAQHVLALRRGVRPALRHGFAQSGVLLRESLPLGLSTLAWAARFFSPMIAVALFVAGPATGSFGAAHRLTVSMHAVVWLWFFNLLPTWSAAAREPGALEALVKRSFLATLPLAGLLIVIVWILSSFAIRLLYGVGYGASVFLLDDLVFVPALAWVSGNFRFGLIARGALRAELAASSSGAVVAIGALLLLRSRLDPTIAAAVFVGAEAVTLLVAWALWRRKLGARDAGGTATAAR